MSSRLVLVTDSTREPAYIVADRIVIVGFGTHQYDNRPKEYFAEIVTDADAYSVQTRTYESIPHLLEANPDLKAWVEQGRLSQEARS